MVEHASLQPTLNQTHPETSPPPKTNPYLDLLGTYLYISLAYQPLHSLTKTLTLSWLGILACVLRMPSSSACAFVLHVFILLHAHFPPTLCLSRQDGLQKFHRGV